MKRIVKRVVTIVLLLILLPVLLLALGLLFLSLPPGENLVRREAVSRLEQFTGMDIEIGSLSTNLFSMVTIEDVHVRHPEIAPDSDLVAFARLHVQYELLPLLHREIHVERVELDSLSGHLVRNPEGRFNLPAFPADTTRQDTTAADTSASDSATTSSPPFQLTLGTVRIHLAEATYRDDSRPFAAGVNSLVLVVDGRGRDRNGFDLALDHGRLDTDGRSLEFNQLLLGGHLYGDSLKLDTLHLEVPGAQLAGSGETRLVSDADSTLPVRAGILLTADLDELGRQFRSLIPETVRPLRGKLTVDATISGSTDDPHAQVTLSSDFLGAGRYELNSLAVNADASLHQVTLNAFALGALGGTVRGDGRISLDENLDHHLSLELDGIDLAELQSTFTDARPRRSAAAANPALRGTISGRVSSSGALQEPWSLKASATLDARVHEPNGSIPASYKIALGYRDHLADLQFQRGGAIILASAAVDTNRIDGTFQISVPEIAELTTPVGIDSLTGSLVSSGQFSGALSSPRVKATVRSSGLIFRNFPVDSLYAAVEYDTSGVRIIESYLSGGIASVDSSRAPFGLKELGGGFHYDIRVSGTFPDLTAELNLDGRRLVYADLTTDSLNLQVRMADGRIELTQAQLFRDRRWFNLRGDYDLERRSGELSLSLNDTEPRAPENPLEIARRIQSSAMRNVSGFGRLDFTFALLDSGRVKISGQGREINLSRLPGIHPAIRKFDGRMNLKLEFEGSAREPHGRVKLEIDSLRAADFVVDTLQLTTSLTPGQLDAELRTVVRDSRPLTASLTLPLSHASDGVAFSREQQFTARIAGDGIRIGFLNQMLPEEVSADGILNIACDVSGTLSHPRFLGEMNLDSARVVLGPDLPVLDSIKVNITQYDSSIQVERIQFVGMRRHFNATGEATLGGGGAVDGDFNLVVDNKPALVLAGWYKSGAYSARITLPEMPLETFEDFIPNVKDMQGVLTGQVSVEGDTGLPGIAGQLSVSGLTVDIANVDDNIHDGGFAVEFDNDSVVIDTLFALFGEQGKLIVDGNVQLVDQKPRFDIRLRATNISSKEDDYDLLIDGMTLDFNTDETGRHLLEGDIRLGETRYKKDYRLDSILRQMSAPPTRQIAAPNEILENVELDLRLREAEDLWIDDNLARIRLDANIGVSGTLNSPRITGRIELAEGYVMYLDRKFDIEEGVISFVDTQDINPDLNIVATSEVTDYQQGEKFTYDITLTITGKMKAARLDLSSDPFLEQSSILSLLTFGTPFTAQTDVGSQAESLAGRAVSGYLGSQVGSAIGLESVSVQGNLFAPEESGATLIATKEISNRAEITYVTSVSGFRENTIRISYFLTRNWTISGETNQEAEGSVDLKFKVRWNEIRWK